MVDFGMAYRYKDGKGHKEEIPNYGIYGTTPYMSIGAHLSNSQSRRDDLESLAYVMMKLRLGHFPWDE